MSEPLPLRKVNEDEAKLRMFLEKRVPPAHVEEGVCRCCRHYQPSGSRNCRADIQKACAVRSRFEYKRARGVRIFFRKHDVVYDLANLYGFTPGAAS